jgi:hypothetical protein
METPKPKRQPLGAHTPGSVFCSYVTLVCDIRKTSWRLASFRSAMGSDEPILNWPLKRGRAIGVFKMVRAVHSQVQEDYIACDPSPPRAFDGDPVIQKKEDKNLVPSDV